MQKQKRSYEEANWAKLSPMFRRTHNRLRQLRGLAPIPEPKVDLWVPPVLRKVEKIDESRQDHEMLRVRPSSARQTGGPLPGFMTADEQNWFEDVSRTELKRLPTQEWGGLVALWKKWSRVKPAGRRRLLMHMLGLCRDRSDPPPDCLILRIEKEWKKTRERNRSNTDSMVAVAGHLVRNPKTGSTAIGKLLKIKPTTIEGYFSRKEFWRICAEKARRYDDECALQVLETYIEKFKSTFDYASNETDNVPLSHLVPAMLDSIDGRAGRIETADVAALGGRYDEFMQPEALKSRLWRASDHPVARRGARA